MVSTADLHFFKSTLVPSKHVITEVVDTGLSLCQETSEKKLEAKVAELQQLMEEVKMLKDSVQQETEEKNRLLATITDKDVCLEKAVADTDRLKAQLAEKEEQVGFGLQVALRTGKSCKRRTVGVGFGLQVKLSTSLFTIIIVKERCTSADNRIKYCTWREKHTKNCLSSKS